MKKPFIIAQRKFQLLVVLTIIASTFSWLGEALDKMVEQDLEAIVEKMIQFKIEVPDFVVNHQISMLEEQRHSSRKQAIVDECKTDLALPFSCIATIATLILAIVALKNEFPDTQTD